jgi:tRNA(fMet)-specific endonuclease VapC
MKYLLDTNACIHALNATCPQLMEHLRAHSPSDIGICTVTAAEMYYGARRSSRISENIELLRTFLDTFPTLPFDEAHAEEYGALRAELAAGGRMIGANDLLIAAMARAEDMTLLSTA